MPAAPNTNANLRQKYVDVSSFCPEDLVLSSWQRPQGAASESAADGIRELPSKASEIEEFEETPGAVSEVMFTELSPSN